MAWNHRENIRLWCGNRTFWNRRPQHQSYSNTLSRFCSSKHIFGSVEIALGPLVQKDFGKKEIAYKNIQKDYSGLSICEWNIEKRMHKNSPKQSLSICENRWETSAPGKLYKPKSKNERGKNMQQKWYNGSTEPCTKISPSKSWCLANIGKINNIFQKHETKSTVGSKK